jgi:Alpha-2,8-polysialyltransferase (POLYST)
MARSAASTPSALPADARGTAAARTQIFLASTLYGAATLAAALDSDRFAAADRRILLVSNNASVPETTPALDETPGFAALADRFDEVLSWNETISPFHPGGWSPRPDDAPLWERHLRLLWDLGDDEIELAVESIQVEPALALVQLFPAAPIHVYADGLMSYGPTRNKLDLLVTTRIRRLLHLDLVPGLTPLLLSEHRVPNEIVPTSAFTAVLEQLAAATPEPEGRPTTTVADTPGAPPQPLAAPAADSAATGRTTGEAAAVAGQAVVAAEAARTGQAVLAAAEAVNPGALTTAAGERGPALLLGQYLAALDILTGEEEEQLHLRMLRGAAARGHRHIVFKPHPTAPARWSQLLEKEAAELGVEFSVHSSPVLAEVLFQRLRPALVVGCFSTALFTASALYGIPVARTGTDLLLERLAPFQNSNRVPVTIVDVLLPPLDNAAASGTDPAFTPPSVAELTALLRALGYCMQSKSYPHLREDAIAYLAKHLDSRTRRYFKRRRLTSLALPGAVPAQLAFLPRNPTVRRVARRARRVLKTRAARRRTARQGTN